MATSTAVSGSGVSINFNAQGVLVKGKQTTFTDITNAVSTLWTSNNNPPGGIQVLQPPTSSHGGQYTGLNDGCACINASSSGITSQPITVGVGVSSGSCPPCATVTATPAAAAAQISSSDGQSNFSATVLWTFNANAPVAGPIVSGPDGTANFITSDRMLHSIDTTGHQVFDRPAGGLAAAVAPDGTIFAQGTTSWIYGLDNRGRPKWKAQVGTGNGPLAADGTAVYAGENGNLIALSDGQTSWSLPVGNPTRGVIIPGGVAVASNGGDIAAATANGSWLWNFAPAGGFRGELAVANGVVYAGSATGGIYALDASTGSVIWRVPSSAPVTSGPSVSGTGLIFFGSDALYAVDSSGTVQWSSKSLVPLPHAIAALSSGTVFDAIDVVASSAMLDLGGNVEWSARDLGTVVQVSAGPSGSVYVASSDGNVRALR
ncbi:MAG: PQQ-binding-like beta-propeller repeat protein [Deltaproteobacteria bacterium]|nr:PQQ-binding-like beta-propeller repeat protein [Deltaproteobacteria bacterium]